MKKRKKGRHFIKKAFYKGGMAAMRTFIKENLCYPKDAVEAKIEGTVNLRYSINKEGDVFNTRVISGIGHGCNKEAKRLVGLFKFEIPKNHSGKLIFHKTLQIHFRLPKIEIKKTEINAPKVFAMPTILEYSYVKKEGSSSGYSYDISNI